MREIDVTVRFLTGGNYDSGLNALIIFSKFWNIENIEISLAITMTLQICIYDGMNCLLILNLEFMELLRDNHKCYLQWSGKSGMQNPRYWFTTSQARGIKMKCRVVTLTIDKHLSGMSMFPYVPIYNVTDSH